jgi:ribosomal protein S27AE
MGSATYNCPKCGEPIRVSRGNNKQSASFAAFMEREGRVCAACAKAEFVAEHQAKVAAAASDERNATLPALTGSEKQIAWATALRLDALPKIEQAMNELFASVDRGEVPEALKTEAKDAVALIATELRKRDEARQWIDGRETNFRDAIWREFHRRVDEIAPNVAAAFKARA